MPFELGRPFGAPNEPEFQTKVLSSLMSLLERTDGPVILEDFDEDPPGGHSFEESGVFCPVGFPKLVVESNTEVLREVFIEIDLMKPWYNLSLDERGRTTFGLAGLNIKEAVKFLAGFLWFSNVVTVAYQENKESRERERGTEIEGERYTNKE